MGGTGETFSTEEIQYSSGTGETSSTEEIPLSSGTGETSDALGSHEIVENLDQAYSTLLNQLSSLMRRMVQERASNPLIVVPNSNSV